MQSVRTTQLVIAARAYCVGGKEADCFQFVPGGKFPLPCHMGVAVNCNAVQPTILTQLETTVIKSEIAIPDLQQFRCVANYKIFLY